VIKNILNHIIPHFNFSVAVMIREIVRQISWGDRSYADMLPADVVQRASHDQFKK